MSSPSAAPVGVAQASRYNDDGTHPDFPVVGFRFSPSAQEIIRYFLSKKVSGKEMADGPIKELDVYRFDPDQLPITITNGRERWMYFFVFMSQDNMGRSTLRGIWKIDEQNVCIKDELTNEDIGFKNSFVYYANELGPNRRYKTKDEYKTNGIENPNDPLMKNWILCKIETPIPREVVEGCKEDKGKACLCG